MKELSFAFHQIEGDKFGKRQPNVRQGDVWKLQDIGIHQLPVLLPRKTVSLIVDGEVQFLHESEQALHSLLVNAEVIGQFLPGRSCRGG